VTLARGSSDNAATYARYLIETRLGLLTSSAAPSVSSVYHRQIDMRDTLVLAISQSGRSPDLIATLKHAQAAGAFIVALVNAPDTPLEKLAHLTLPLHAGPERSVAATKSCVAAMAALADLTAAWSDDHELAGALARLPQQLEQAWSCDWTPALGALLTARDMYVIGRGVGFGIAQEAALKLKETCSLHAEAFSAAEVLHGPAALVREGFPVLALSQNDESRDGVGTVAERLRAGGARMLLAGLQTEGAMTLPTIAASPLLEPILMTQSFYRMAEALSRARGHDPDRPPHLQKVTETV